MSESEPLKDKKALITGGSRGIGAAIVERFRQEGADTIFTYAASADEAAAVAQRTGAQAVQADSVDRNAVKAVIESAGPLDILVANAGRYLMGPALELNPDDVDYLIDLNIRGPYHAAVDAARRMNREGRIIVIGSANGDRMPVPGAAAYAMSKSALQGMVRGLARDFGDRGITVNNVQPGPVDTDMNPADGPMAGAMHTMMAIKRHARAPEVAALVAFLAGPDAAMVTGAMLTIDGGFSA